MGQAFTCENEECEKLNENLIAYVNDWGNYTVDCEFCGKEYTSGNVRDDAEEAAADARYEEWRERDWDN